MNKRKGSFICAKMAREKIRVAWKEGNAFFSFKMKYILQNFTKDISKGTGIMQRQ